MRFEQPDWLWIALLAAAVGCALVLAWYRRRRRALDALGSAGLMQRLMGTDLLGSPARRAVLIAGVLGFCGVALAGPQWGVESVEEETRSLDVVLVLDISESMWAEDVRPSRLERERLEARRLVTELAGHRLGLVAFAGGAYVLSPLTVDHSAVHLYLDAVDPTIAAAPGSSLAEALRSSARLFEPEARGGDRAVIVLSDGESHDEPSAVRAAARELSGSGIHVYGIGIGSETGEPIPRHDRLGERLGGYKRDAEGNVVLTRLQREPLAEAARATGGFWTRADEGGTARILSALSELRHGRGESDRGIRATPRFQWAIAVALLLLVGDSFLARRRSG